MISIITPSFNQGEYIEETIRSVLYSKERLKSLQYIVIDGGSTDKTTYFLEKYQNQIDYWISEQDKGQVDAINKGLKIISHDVFNWLNSDDYFLPGTLDALNTIIEKHPEFDIYAFVGAGSGEIGAVSAWFSFWPDVRFEISSFQLSFGQESTFIRKTFLDEKSIKIEEGYDNIFDTVLYQEMLVKGARVLLINVIGGVIRHHDLAKTSQGAPSSDKSKFIDFQNRMFNQRQKIWIKITKTRFRNILKYLFSNILFRTLVINLFDLRSPEYHVCDFSGNKVQMFESWTIYRKK